jgi:hypothetical protein
MKDLLDPKPGGIVRLKPEAYGTDVRMIMQQFPIQDVTQNHLRDIQLFLGFGERTVGVNDQIMGMLQGSGRKTATEVRTSTTFGVNRLKTVCEYISATGFSPLAQMLLQNTQQYYDETQKFKIAGDLISTAGQAFMTVNPEMIMGAYDFVPVDGTLPIDRFAQVNLWMQLMTQARSDPVIGLQYDMARIFEWVAQLAGLKNITQFKVQVAPDPALLNAARLGNVVPMGGKRPGAQQPGGPRALQQPVGNRTSPQQPKQLPGMGPAG